jgi:hypothetical protein
MRRRVAGWQMHVTGGNLVTGAAYGMDPVTGEWVPNAFPDRTDERLRDDLLPHWRCHRIRRARSYGSRDGASGNAA